MENMKPEKTALLVVDLQNEFVEEVKRKKVKIIEKNLGKVRDFIDFCRGKGIEVIYTRHCFDPEKNIIEAKMFPAEMCNALRKGSSGWEIHEGIRPEEGEKVVDKHKYDAFFGTGLNDILKSKGIENVVIIGTMTQVCCESTARAATFHDYNVFFVSDLNFTFDEEMQDRTLKVIKRNFGKVMNSEDVKKELV